MSLIRRIPSSLCPLFPLFTLGIALFSSPDVSAQQGAPAGEWPSYGGDLGHTRYAPLNQIDAENFDQLDVAWRFKTDNLGP